MTMDVDLLRPGTVPISPDTVLWFEFLLNPSLLYTHISKPSPDPSPTDLIIKFMNINAEQSNDVKIIENDVNEVKVNSISKWTYKNLALKILSLKVAAYLKWDLDLLQKKLPLHIQVTLLQDLFYITTDSMIEIPVVPEYPPDTVSDKILFTLVLYHRWLIQAIVYRALNNKQLKSLSFNPMLQENIFLSTPMNDEIIRKLELQATQSVNFLNGVLQLTDMKPKVLSFDTFQMLTENSTEVKQNWDDVHSITEDEFKCQIHYDLAVFHFLREEYQSAKHHICQAKVLYSKIDTSSLLFCTITKEHLDGYCLACEVSVEGKEPDLTQQLLTSIKDQYTNIIQILQADNVTREIPMVYRDNLELDIQGGLVNRKIVVAKDLLLQIQCLNLVRRIVENDTIIGDYIANLKAAGPKGLDIFFWALYSILGQTSSLDMKRIARHLLYLVIMGDIDGLAKTILKDSKLASLFSPTELQEIRKEESPEDLDIPNLLLNNDWGIAPVDYTQKVKIEVFELEQRLILSYNSNEIRQILIEIVHLDTSKDAKPLWRINNAWEIPIPLQSVICSIPEGFLKDYSYILLAKSKELALSKDFPGARALLSVVENEVQHHAQTLQEAPMPLLGGNNIIFKLTRLLNWESLLTEICHCLHAWPATDVCDMQSLVIQCKQCLATFQSSDQVLPRQEIIEYCTVFLLNMKEWEYLTNLEKQWPCFEFAAALSNVAKLSEGHKFPKEIWDMFLAACKLGRDLPQKRSNNSGSSGNSISRDTLASITSILSRLREVTVLNIAISMLARLYNILRDESSLELYTTYLNMWPATIPNPKQYNMRAMGEYLYQLLSQALKYYPNNIAWLRLMGDLNFVLGFYESAMKYYLEAIIVVTDLFTERMQNAIDDLVYRRMIKCCAHLQCNTQAVVLCQFLDEVDYALAFKMAGNEQKNAVPNDAMDAYYHCIWDTTILEYLINLHTKRGEYHRKQLAIKVIGLLELNSNNNGEIQKEAANTRKARFLRALAKQYVY